MNKDHQIRIRITREEKELITTSAKEQNMTTSKYLLSLAQKDSISLSHEQQIVNSVPNNQIVNNLLANPQIPNYVKEIIGKELREYVGYTN